MSEPSHPTNRSLRLLLRNETIQTPAGECAHVPT
jgi:hypothetical protein